MISSSRLSNCQAGGQTGLGAHCHQATYDSTETRAPLITTIVADGVNQALCLLDTTDIRVRLPVVRKNCNVALCLMAASQNASR